MAAFVVTQFGATGSVAATERAVVDINAQLDTGEAVAGTGDGDCVQRDGADQ